jgi:hypothetical protein
MNIFLVIVTTFEDVFTRINDIRRKQCAKYNIPVLFVYNGTIPEGYELKNDERIFPMEAHAPGMFLKLKVAIEEIYELSNCDPDYILRCTSRCYVNFKNLPFLVSYLGKQNVLAGPYQLNDAKLYIAGFFMLFSRDVAKQFLKEENVQGPVLWHSDDCTISWAVKSYANFYDTQYFVETLANKTEMPTELPEFKNTAVIFRIKSGPVHATPFGTPMCLGEEIDVAYWKLLVKKYDDIMIDS